MTRLLAMAAALAAVLYLLNDTSAVRLSDSVSFTGTIAGHTGASRAAVGGIAGAAG